MFDRIAVGNLIYLGSHPWNTGDVYGHCVVIEKTEHYMLVQGIDLRVASGWAATRRGRYSVAACDARKIIRLA